jgi:hypothetical protein
MPIYTDEKRKGLPRVLSRNAQMRAYFGQEGDEHLVSVRVPIIGKVDFHRDVGDALKGVFRDIVDLGLEELVDLDDFGGTYCLRKARGSTLWSPHAWGAAIDLNVHHLQRGGKEWRSRDRMNYLCRDDEIAPSLKRLSYLFHRWGFGWGGDWEGKDVMHYESTDITLKILNDKPLPQVFIDRMYADGKPPAPRRLV